MQRHHGAVVAMNFSLILNASDGPFSTGIPFSKYALLHNASDNDDVIDSEGIVGPGPFQLLSEEVGFWVHRVMVPVVAFFGILGNVVTIRLLTRKRMMEGPTNLYLTALATADLLYLVFTSTLSLFHYPNVNHQRYYVYWKYRPYGLWLTDSASNTAVWLTVSFTIERWLVVNNPMRRRLSCTESRAKKVIVGVFITCFLAAAPTPFEWVIEEVAAPAGLSGDIRIRFKPSQLALDPMFRALFYWFTALGFVFIPLVLLITFNTMLVISVHKSTVRRLGLSLDQHQLHQLAHQETHVTVLLIVVVCVFLCCQTPTAISLIVSFFYEPERGTEAWYQRVILRQLFNFLMAVNAAINFLLYCAMSQRYRREFCRILCPIFCWHMCHRTSSAEQAETVVLTPVLSRRPRRSTMNRTIISRTTSASGFAVPSDRRNRLLLLRKDTTLESSPTAAEERHRQKTEVDLIEATGDEIICEARLKAENQHGNIIGDSERKLELTSNDALHSTMDHFEQNAQMTTEAEEIWPKEESEKADEAVARNGELRSSGDDSLPTDDRETPPPATSSHRYSMVEIHPMKNHRINPINHNLGTVTAV